jgi:hypothetical protein
MIFTDSLADSDLCADLSTLHHNGIRSPPRRDLTIRFHVASNIRQSGIIRVN